MRVQYRKEKYGEVSQIVIDNESSEVAINIDGNPPCVLSPTNVW